MLLNKSTTHCLDSNRKNTKENDHLNHSDHAWHIVAPGCIEKPPRWKRQQECQEINVIWRAADRFKRHLPSELRQGDALKRADDVVGAFGGEETFVVTGAEVPVRAFVIFVPEKSPDAADYNQATDPVVPEIADVMKAQVRAGVGAFEADVIVKDELGQPDGFLGDGRSFFAGGAGVISERAQFPFHVDDTAVIRREFGFRYLFHRRRRFNLDLELIAAAVSSSLVGAIDLNRSEPDWRSRAVR